MRHRAGARVPGTEGGAGPGDLGVSFADPWPWNFPASHSGLQQRCEIATWACVFLMCIFPFACPCDHLSVFKHCSHGRIVWCIGRNASRKVIRLLALILFSTKKRK